MAGQVITKQELIDAQKDAQTLEDAVNGEPGKLIKSRAGREFYSLASVPQINTMTREEVSATVAPKADKVYVDNIVSAAANGVIPFQTQSELLLAKPTQVKVLAKAMDVRKEYLWNRTSAEGVTPVTGTWVDTGLSDKDQALNEIKPIQASTNLLKSQKFNGSYGEIIPFFTDSTGKIILGFDITTEKLIGAIESGGNSVAYDQDYTAKPLAAELKPLAGAVNGFIGYGQSLAIGMTSSGLNIPLSTTQPFYNLTFAPSVKSTTGATGVKPLVEDTVLPVGSDTGFSGETPCSGMANYASLLAYKQSGIKPENHKIFSSTCGKGASTIGALLNTSAWYLEHFIGTLDKAVALNTGFKLHAVAWEQGESDASANVAYATYYQRLNQLQAGIETDAKSRTGQTSPVHFITASLSTRIKLGEGPVKAMFDAVKNNPKIHFSTPTHFIPRVDGTHLTQVGYKWLGAFYGRVYKQLVIDQIEPKWLEPISVIQKSNIIDVKYRVPCKPLQLNTSFLAATTNSGFKVLDGATNATITKIEVVDTDTVRITLSAAPINAVTLRYGLDYLGTGLDVNEGCSGNVMDSTDEKCTIVGVDYPMPYVSPHFEMPALKGEF